MRLSFRHGFCAATLAVAGCGGDGDSHSTTHKGADTQAKDDDPVAAVREKLSVDDRALVNAQEWCVVNTTGRLGSMGAPVKLSVKGQSVFLCCVGCKRKAEADPEKTLATLEELKKKAKSAVPKS